MAASEAQPLQPPIFGRASSSCERHPDESVTGFCASCLRERLEGLETASHRISNSSAASAASAALKSLFFRPAPPRPSNNADATSSSRPSFVPELRRCKSFSGRPPARFLPAMEPQRKSCDVRGRNTLWTLFHLDDAEPVVGAHARNDPFPATSYNLHVGEFKRGKCEDEQRDEVTPVVLEQEEHVINDREEGTAATEELTIKDHMDLIAETKKSSPKDLKEIAGSFWLAASVFSKKLQTWRRKQKLKRQEAQQRSKCSAAAGFRRSKPSSVFQSRRFSQSEDAFGRRSCDTDPRRYSLDAGRMSLDDPRFSWDEPRASWDGYLIGHRPAPPRQPSMLSVIEDAPAPVQRLDGQIPVEEDAPFPFPGGVSQTRDYYLDPALRRRRSLDRSLSSARRSFSVEGDESLLPRSSILRSSSPTDISTEYFHLVDRFERGDYVRNPLGDAAGRSESFDSAILGDPSREGNGNTKAERMWSKAWSLWGLIHRRSRNSAAVERCAFSGPWPEPSRRDEVKTLRCSSSLSSRSASSNWYPRRSVAGGVRRSGLQVTRQGKNRTGELVLERSRSARLSPGRAPDRGMLRLYLAPMRSGSRRSGGGGGSGKSAHQAVHPHSFTRSAMQLY